MSERGVFAVDRGVFDHPVLQDDAPFCRKMAWLWLLSNAAWKAHRRRISGKIIEVQRGELIASSRFLAKEWRWAEAKVRRFLKALQTDAMIDARTDAGVTRLTICKYNNYQRVSLPTDAPSDAPSDAGVTQDRRKVESKEDREKKNSVPNGTGGEPPDSLNLLKQELWREGKALLRGDDERSDREAGALLTKLVKASGNNLAQVLAKVRECRQTAPPPIEPFTWLMARVSTKRAEKEEALAETAKRNWEAKLDKALDDGEQGRDQGVH